MRAKRKKRKTGTYGGLYIKVAHARALGIHKQPLTARKRLRTPVHARHIGACTHHGNTACYRKQIRHKTMAVKLTFIHRTQGDFFVMQVKHGNERLNCRHVVHNNNVRLACKRMHIYLIKTTPAPKKLSYRKKNSAQDCKKYTTRAWKFTHCVRVKPRIALSVRCRCCRCCRCCS